jgi:hypothetical protein
MKLPDWKTFAGILAMAATLVLSLPGVEAVRAEDEVGVISLGLVDSGLSCDPDAGTTAPSSAHVYLRSESDAAEGQGSAPVALNNQGYSYHVPGVDSAARELERR